MNLPILRDRFLYEALHPDKGWLRMSSGNSLFKTIRRGRSEAQRHRLASGRVLMWFATSQDYTIIETEQRPGGRR